MERHKSLNLGTLVKFDSKWFFLSGKKPLRFVSSQNIDVIYRLLAGYAQPKHFFTFYILQNVKSHFFAVKIFYSSLFIFEKKESLLRKINEKEGEKTVVGAGTIFSKIKSLVKHRTVTEVFFLTTAAISFFVFFFSTHFQTRQQTSFSWRSPIFFCR